MDEPKRVGCLAYTPCDTNSPSTPQHHLSNILGVHIVTFLGSILNNPALFRGFQTFLSRWNGGDAIWTRAQGEMTVARREIPFGSYSMLFDLAGKAEHLFRATLSPE